MGSACIAQEAHLGALWLPRGVGWVGDGKEVQEGGAIHVHTYGWFMLMYGKNQNNILKQLSSNLK